MRMLRSTTLTAAATFVLASGNASGQDYEPQYYPASSPYTQLFSAQELDNLVAPIALYPDPILAQVFVAATFADQIDIAARHVRMFGDNSVDYQPWDVSVRAVAHYPPVLNMLAERSDWTAALGQAYAYQSDDLMDAVQRLRRMAQYEGNLISTSHQTIIYDRDYIRIVPAQPRVIYVPVYDPYAIYYRRAVFSASFHTPYWSFGVAFPIGSWLNYDCDWMGRRVYYDGWRGGGNGWRSRSRPFIQIVNVYVHPRYEVVNINRTIINRNVNYINLNTYNTVHRNVKFDGYARNVTRVVAAENGSRRGGGGGGGGAVIGGGQRSAVPVGRGGADLQGSGGGRAAGRGANAQSQSQSRPLPQQTQQGAQPQGGQRTASPSGRAQPVQRPTQPPVMQQRQQAPVTQRQPTQQSAPGQSAPRSAVPNGRGQSAQRPAQSQPSQVIRQQPNVEQQQRQQPAVQQRQQPAVQQRQQPAVQQRQQPAVQQRQQPAVQQRQQPAVQQRQQPAVQQRQQPSVQQQRSLPSSGRAAQPRSAQSSAPAAASRGGGSSSGGGQVIQKSKGSAGGQGGQPSAQSQARGRGRG